MKGHHFELEFWIVTIRRGPAWRNSKHRLLNSRFSSNHYSSARYPLESWGLCCFFKLVELSLCETVFTWPGRKLFCHFPKNMLLPGALVCYGVHAVVAFLCQMISNTCHCLPVETWLGESWKCPPHCLHITMMDTYKFRKKHVLYIIIHILSYYT